MKTNIFIFVFIWISIFFIVIVQSNNTMPEVQKTQTIIDDQAEVAEDFSQCHIHYIYYKKIDICYAIIVEKRYETYFVKTMTVVPYEKVKDIATIIE